MERLKEFKIGEKVQIKPTLTDFNYGGYNKNLLGKIGSIESYEYWDDTCDSYCIIVIVDFDDNPRYYMSENELIKAEDF